MKQERLTKVLLAPHVSEKSTNLGSINQYVFEVANAATKPQIKAAVEALFKVKVKNVRVLNVMPKAKRFGRTEGTRQGWRKAYVSLHAGDKIELMGHQHAN